MVKDATVEFCEKSIDLIRRLETEYRMLQSLSSTKIRYEIVKVQNELWNKTSVVFPDLLSHLKATSSHQSITMFGRIVQ